LQAATGLPGGWSDTVSVTNNAPNSYVPPTALPKQFFRLKFRPIPPLP
jgi:hypothetical protein